MILKKQNVTLSCTPQWKEGGISKLTILLKRNNRSRAIQKKMKYTDTELEEILNKLVASTRSPRGRFSATASYPELEKRLKSHTRRLTLIRTFSAAAAVALLCLSVWTAYLYMQPVTIQTVSTLAETRTVCLPDGSTVTLNHYSSLSYPEKFKSDKREVKLNGEAYLK